jgi:hypothetical protein
MMDLLGNPTIVGDRTCQIPYHFHHLNTSNTKSISVFDTDYSVLIISIHSGNILVAPNLFKGGSTMSNHTTHNTLLFTKCINLNTDQCQYTKNPEEILSLFSDPANFAIDDQKVQELNDTCSNCDSYQIN